VSMFLLTPSGPPQEEHSAENNDLSKHVSNRNLLWSLTPSLGSAEKLAFTLRQGSGRTGRGLIILRIFRSC